MEQNLIKSKWMHKQKCECLHILFTFVAFRCAFECQNYIKNSHSNSGRCISLSEYSSFEKFMTKSNIQVSVCIANKKDANCHDEPHITVFESTICFHMFIKHTHKSLCAHTHTPLAPKKHSDLYAQTEYQIKRNAMRCHEFPLSRVIFPFYFWNFCKEMSAKDKSTEEIKLPLYILNEIYFRFLTCAGILHYYNNANIP